MSDSALTETPTNQLRTTKKQSENPIPQLVIYYAEKGLNNVEIAHQLNVTEGAIRYWKDKLKYNPNESQLYEEHRKKLQKMIQSKITGKQLEYVTQDDTKIENWRDMRDAQLVKATEQSKEIEIINNFTSNITFNFEDMLQKRLQLMDKDVKDIDTIDVECKEITDKDSDNV